MTRKPEATSRKGKEGGFATQGGLLYQGSRVLAVSPLLVALCLGTAGVPPIPSRQVLPNRIGNRILRIATFLEARLALDGPRVNVGGNDERA